MKLLLIFINILIMFATSAQNSIVHIKKRDFEGFIFDEKFFVFKSIDNQKSRYTPTEQDIISAEMILKSELSKINRPLVNQVGECPIIHKNLSKYIRQYVGFINDNGEVIIWINFLWKKNIYDSEAGKDIIFVSDGCSYYWDIEVNITTKSLSNLKINGLG